MVSRYNGLGRRVIRRLSQTGTTQKELAAATGLTQSFISHICTGRVKTIGSDLIFPLAEALQCDAKWLAMGERAETEETE